MTYQNLIQSFKKKIYLPVYLLMGENDYYIDKVSNYIQDNFFDDEGVKDFNLEILYGKDTTVNEIVSLAKQFPMMSDYRVLIVKEAQNLERSIADLLPYVQNPQKQTILVLCYKYKNLDKRLSLFKAIDKMGGVFESPKVYDNQVPKYVKEIVAENKFIISDYTAQLIAIHIGTDLSRIENEIIKLKNIIKEGEEISPELVEEYIGISREFNEFELINAIWARDASKAFQIIQYFESNPKNYPNAKTLPLIYNGFIKLMQYHFAKEKRNLKTYNIFNAEAEKAFRSAVQFYTLDILKAIIHLLKMYDLKSKGHEGCDIDDHELLKELTIKIITCNFS